MVRVWGKTGTRQPPSRNMPLQAGSLYQEGSVQSSTSHKVRTSDNSLSNRSYKNLALFWLALRTLTGFL